MTPIHEGYQTWQEDFLPRRRHYEGHAPFTADELTRRLVATRIMLNEYTVIRDEKRHGTAQARLFAEHAVMESERYRAAKNDAERRHALAYDMETSASALVSRWRMLSGDLAWYEHEVDRIAVELDTLKDQRRARELAAGVRIVHD